MLLDPGQPLFLQWRHLHRLAPWLRAYLRNCNPDRVAAIADALYQLTGDSLADHQSLAQGTGAERYVVASDYAYLYRDRAQFEADAYGWNIRRAHGFCWDELEGDALRAWEPLFSAELGFAARLPGHGLISDPGAYVGALARHLEAQGGRILKADVTDFRIEAGRVTGVRASGETLDCDAVVIAAGAWSRVLAAKLGFDIPLEGERGYHLDLIDPDRMPVAPCMVASGKFVVTPMEGRIRLAGIVEFGHVDAPPSRAPFALLRRGAAAAMPGLRWREVREWMGVRPAPSDSIPLIGPVPGVAGAWLGLGHHHVGMTAGPKTGEILAGMIQSRSSNMDLLAFDPLRFAAPNKKRTGRTS